MECSPTSLEDIAAYYHGRLAELSPVCLIPYPLITAVDGL